jgi:hypothetical protein
LFSTTRPSPELIVANARQFFDESYDGPDFMVGYVDSAKAGHASHIDSVLNYPEQLLWRALISYLLEIGGIRM